MSVLTLAVCMGIYYWFCRLRFGYTFSSMLLQPVVIGVFVGLLTGNMELSMKIGAGLQLVYLGVTSTPGGNVPSDPALAGCIAIPLGVMSNMTPEVAIALAIPFGVIGVFVDQLRRSTNAIWVHMADRYAEKADTKGILRAAFLYPAIAGFIIRFPIVFAIDFFGVTAVEKLISVLPRWLMHSFEIMGGILPALGFAITLSVIGKKSLVPFFIIGFFAVMYLQLDTMAVAIFATCMALLLGLFQLKEEAV
ncbi:MAG: PTS sugar transporter subunit IIC [Lacrimispora sp.]|uniref:PTS mannose/fructose/sorbose/N-acetylgalactosamine transporter subunit IIC n=1 Tax=Lacrimispora sp. TaxID=2719234 RepID=UPI0039E31D64